MLYDHTKGTHEHIAANVINIKVFKRTQIGFLFEKLKQ